MNDKTHRKEKETKNGKYMFGSGKYNGNITKIYN